MDESARIVTVMSHYCQSIDDRRFDDLAALMTDDVRFEMGADVTESVTEYIAYMHANLWPPGRHLCFNPAISIAGDKAFVTSDWLYLDSELHIVAAGRYNDDFVLVDGEWRFVVRRISVFEPSGSK